MERRSLIISMFFLLWTHHPLEARHPQSALLTTVVFSGIAVDSTLHRITHSSISGLKEYFITGIAIAKDFLSIGPYITLGAEIQATKHFERSDLYQFNPAFVIRFLTLPWSSIVDSSFSFGNGISYATGISEFEKRGRNISPNFLYYLFLEFSFSPEIIGPWEAMLRIHHRSGVFGLLQERVGSNYLCLGMKHNF